jgi:hypothetical protein
MSAMAVRPITVGMTRYAGCGPCAAGGGDEFEQREDDKQSSDEAAKSAAVGRSGLAARPFFRIPQRLNGADALT